MTHRDPTVGSQILWPIKGLPNDPTEGHFLKNIYIYIYNNDNNNFLFINKDIIYFFNLKGIKVFLPLLLLDLTLICNGMRVIAKNQKIDLNIKELFAKNV